MNNLDEINELIEIFGHHYKNTENLKMDIVRAIENIVKEILSINQFLKQFKLINISYINDIEILKTMKKIFYLDKEKLKLIIQFMSFSEYLKEIFDIAGELNIDELYLLEKDIEESIFALRFEADNDISNFIIAYMKRFIEEV